MGVHNLRMIAGGWPGGMHNLRMIGGAGERGQTVAWAAGWSSPMEIGRRLVT